MLVQSKQLNGARIVSLHTGHAIGSLGVSIINPHKLELAGFYVNLPKASKQPFVLLTQDIRQFAQGRVFINSGDEIVAATELLRLKETLSLNFSLTDKPVRSVSKRRVGKVTEYVVETTGWVVQKLYVSQPFFKSFSTGTLIIDRSQIIEVNDRQVTVADAAITAPAVVPSRVT